jgi:hypothetical protein
MNALAYLVLVIVIVLPIAWFASEFSGHRRLRLALGVGAILASFGVAWIAGSLEMFNANAWFGFSTKGLIDTTVSELERGNSRQVLASLKELQGQYRPTYENRARYDELVGQAVKRMQSTPAASTQ